MAPRTATTLKYLAGGLALAALLAMGIFYFSSGLLAPGWAVAVFIGIWVALFIASIVLLVRRRPLLVIPAPVIAAVIWFGGMTAGEVFLGWTA